METDGGTLFIIQLFFLIEKNRRIDAAAVEKIRIIPKRVFPSRRFPVPTSAEFKATIPSTILAAVRLAFPLLSISGNRSRILFHPGPPGLTFFQNLSRCPSLTGRVNNVTDIHTGSVTATVRAVEYGNCRKAFPASCGVPDSNLKATVTENAVTIAAIS